MVAVKCIAPMHNAMVAPKTEKANSCFYGLLPSENIVRYHVVLSLCEVEQLICFEQDIAIYPSIQPCSHITLQGQGAHLEERAATTASWHDKMTSFQKTKRNKPSKIIDYRL